MEQIHETMKGATVTRMQVGPLATNCYLAQSGTELMLIDPGMASDRELEDVVTVIESTHANLRWVVCTHGHLDHVSGADAVMSRFPTATLLMNPMEVALARKPAHSSDLKMRSLSTMHTEPSPLAAGDELPLGLITYRIAAVPGHTPGGLVLIAEDHAFVGDTLLAGCVCGIPDQPTFDQLVTSIRTVLMTLPLATHIFPGHGKPTTIGAERKNNPVL